MQRAREALLADAALAAKQHGRVGAGDAARQRGGRVEGGRGADEVVRAARGGCRAFALASCLAALRRRVDEVFRLEEAQLFFVDILPLRERPADDAAARMSHRHAFDLAPQHDLAGHGGRVTGGVADHGPAYRCAAQTGILQMGFRLPRGTPVVVAPKLAGLGVEAHAFDRLVAHESFELAQARPERECLCGVLMQVAHAAAVFHALLIAKPREQLAHLVRAEQLDQLAAQFGEGECMHQQHTLVEQHDLAGVGREAHVARQVPVDFVGDGALAGASVASVEVALHAGFSMGRIHQAIHETLNRARRVSLHIMKPVVLQPWCAAVRPCEPVVESVACEFLRSAHGSGMRFAEACPASSRTRETGVGLYAGLFLRHTKRCAWPPRHFTNASAAVRRLARTRTVPLYRN